MSASRSVRSAPKFTYRETRWTSFPAATSAGMYAVVSETTATLGTAAQPTPPRNWSSPATSYTPAADAGVRPTAGRGAPRRADARDRDTPRGAPQERRGPDRGARRLRPAPGRSG